MSQIVRGACLVGAVVIFASASAALADSRIFSARSAKPDVTIEQALVDGNALPVIGRGEGSTIFRLDTESGPVPCTNEVEFVTSDQQHVAFAGDFCALNWQVTVDGSEAAAPAAPAPSRIVVAGGTQSVTLATDDPKITIEGVTLDRQPIAIVERKANTVRIEVEGTTDGVKCQRELGLHLSDQRSLDRNVNICANDGSLVVALAEGAAKSASSGSTTEAAGPPPPPPAAAADGAPGVSPQPAESQSPAETASLPQPAEPGAEPVPAPEVALPMVWSFAGEGDSASLTFGVAESDAIAFTASCTRPAKQAQAVLPPLVPDLQPGAPVSVVLSAGAFSKTYAGVGSPVSEETGQSQPLLEVPLGDPLWQAIISESLLIATAAPEPPYEISLKGSAGPARQFLATCAPELAPPPVAVAQPGGPGTTVSFSCADGTNVTVTFDRAKQTALLAEPGAPPVLLYRRPARVGEQFIAGPSRLVGRDETIRWTRFGERPRVCWPAFG